MQITVPDADGHKLEVLWTNGPHKAHLFVDFEAQDFHTVVTREEEGHRMHSVRYTCALALSATCASMS